MSRPARLLDWTGPTAAEQLRARVLALKVELAEAEDRLYALQTAPPTTPPPADVFLKAADAAARYGWCADTIRRWAKSGRIRSVSSGGRVRVSKADLAAMQRPAGTQKAAHGAVNTGATEGELA